MSIGSFPPDLPPAIKASKLYANGGALFLADLVGPEAVKALETEAWAVRSEGRRNELAVSQDMGERGGNPGRAFKSALAGESHWKIFSAPELVTALAEACGLAAVPTGGGSYSYYEQPGDFLALHRDILTCDLTVLTGLRDTHTDSGGGLFIYSEHSCQPLANARKAGRSSATFVPLHRGESVALLGGVVPHEVAPMAAGQERVVSVMCYRVSGLS